jgi:hypothetical protein
MAGPQQRLKNILLLQIIATTIILCYNNGVIKNYYFAA